MLTFPAGIAAKVAGIPHNSINSLLSRGIVTLEGDAPGPGRARGYDIATIAKLGLMADVMSGLGMRPEAAADIALLCEAPFKRLVIAQQQTPGTAYLVIRFVTENEGYMSSIVYGLSEVERFLEEEGEQPYALVVNITKAFARTISRLSNIGVLDDDWQTQERASIGLPPAGKRSISEG